MIPRERELLQSIISRAFNDDFVSCLLQLQNAIKSVYNILRCLLRVKEAIFSRASVNKDEQFNLDIKIDF